MKKYFLGLAILTLLVGCSSKENKGEGVWTSLIYPDKNNPKRNMEYGKFPNLQMCQKASYDKLKSMELLSRGYSECGLNCSFHEGMKTLICEEMVTNP
jgi:hypothetical protein